MPHPAPVIGVIGGMGPYAGLDLVRKIFDQIVVETDQEHLPVALLSYPERIIDRSTFLFGKTDTNPAEALAEIALQLDAVGATVAGMPCNTAHAPRIFDALRERVAAAGAGIRLVHMIEETVRHLKELGEGLRCVGVLSTTAVYRLGLYARALQAAGFDVALSDEQVQETVVNPTIFDPAYGIKAHSNPVSQIARQSLLDAIEHLRGKGAEAVILGCTELPLAVPEPKIGDVLLVDPTAVLARALIRETYPDRLA